MHCWNFGSVFNDTTGFYSVCAGLQLDDSDDPAPVKDNTLYSDWIYIFQKQTEKASSIQSKQTLEKNFEQKTKKKTM